MDLTSSNLQGTNAKFNSILSKLEDTKSTAFSNLETAAATATSAISADLSNVTSDLRTLVPEGFSVPNINLQGQLQSLSGLVDPVQSANLLASITADFGDALSTEGFNLDTLVSDAASAFTTGNTLSGVVPNFERSPLGDVIQKANAVKVPSIDPVIEEVSSFTENAKQAATKTAAKDAVYDTFETLPTADAGVFKVSDKFKKVTQSFGGVSITNERTTPILSFENDVRKTISNKGFTNRVFTITEKFTVSDIEDLEGDKVVTLKHEPSKIIKVKGRKNVAQFSGRRIFDFRNLMNLQGFIIDTLEDTYKKDVYSVHILNNKQVVFKQEFREYDGTPWAIKVTYKYNETYDPTFAKPETIET
tara:strand:- start:43 stop:1128 length:1086 start_codon:yes stop_codon:yes gene_type:complete